MNRLLKERYNSYTMSLEINHAMRLNRVVPISLPIFMRSFLVGLNQRGGMTEGNKRSRGGILVDDGTHLRPARDILPQ